MPAFEGRELPHQRTLQRLVKDMQGNVTKATDSEKLLDQPFEWHRLEEYALPWDASAYLLEMWVHVTIRRISSLPLGPPPTTRQVRRWWHVHRAAPEMEKDDVWWVAQEFVVREITSEVLGISQTMADLDAWLAFTPWRGDTYRGLYRFGIERGLIPPLTVPESGSSPLFTVWEKTGMPRHMGLSLCLVPGPPEMLPSQRFIWMENHSQEEERT